MNAKSIVWFDIETTGLDPELDEVIQIAAIASGPFPQLKYSLADEFEIKLMPSPQGVERMAKARREGYTGSHYHEETWRREGRPVMTGLNEFRKFVSLRANRVMFSKKQGSTYEVAMLGGHNVATFDLPFLRAQFKKISMPWKGNYQPLDTLQLATWWREWYAPQQESLTLSDLCKVFELDLHGAHDALIDVRGTIHIARRLAAVMADWGNP